MIVEELLAEREAAAMAADSDSPEPMAIATEMVGAWK
jgi:hypothetical protein